MFFIICIEIESCESQGIEVEGDVREVVESMGVEVRMRVTRGRMMRESLLRVNVVRMRV